MLFDTEPVCPKCAAMAAAGEAHLCDEHQPLREQDRRARATRHLLGVAIFAILPVLGGWLVTLTHDVSLRLLILLPLMALTGLGCALMWFHRDPV